MRTDAPEKQTSVDGCCMTQTIPTQAELETWPTQALIARYRCGVENFDRRVFRLTEDQLNMAFLPDAGVGRWPVRVLLGHLADADLAFVHRMRRAFAETNPVLAVWDEDAFVDSGIYGGSEPKASSPEASQARVNHALGGFIATIHTLRQWSGAWLQTLTEEQLDRKALHPESGPISIRTIMAKSTWHLEHHNRFLSLKLNRMLGEAAEEDEQPSSGCCGGGCACKGG